MDFFAWQRRARRATVGLVAAFVGLLVVLSVAVWAGFLGLYEAFGWRHLAAANGFGSTLFWNAFGGTFAILGGAAIYRWVELGQGGGPLIARRLGGRPVEELTHRDARARVLENIVEELAVATGMPAPSAWVLEHEESINAFAAGMDPGDAVVAVTRGALDRLERDELQAVVAHEFAHLLHGDSRLNIRLLAASRGLSVLADLGRFLLRTEVRGFAPRRGTAFTPLSPFGFVLAAIGSVGIALARVLQAAVSRQREYLADAGAVQFTRDPVALGDALRRIRDASDLAIHHPDAEAASHLFFAAVSRRTWLRLLATHPPLDARIARLEGRPAHAGADDRPTTSDRVLTSPQSALGTMSGFVEPGAHGPRADANAIVTTAGTSSPDHLASGRVLLDGLSLRLRAALHEPFSARAVVLGLLLSTDGSTRRNQLQRLRNRLDSAGWHELHHLAPGLAETDVAVRLPLVELALPALRRQSSEQAADFLAAIDALMPDECIEPFSFALRRVLRHYLDRDRSRRPRPGSSPWRGVPDVQIVLGVFARAGHDDADAELEAFRDGCEAWRQAPGSELAAPSSAESLPPFETLNWHALDEALERLEASPQDDRKRVLNACARAAASDGVLAIAEIELLRGFAAALDTPMPPPVVATTGTAPGQPRPS